MTEYVVFRPFDDPYSIKGICETEADAQEFLLSLIEEESYKDFLRDFYYDIMGRFEGEDPLIAYLKELTPTVEYHNKESFYKTKNLSVHGYDLINHAYWYDIAKVETY